MALVRVLQAIANLHEAAPELPATAYRLLGCRHYLIQDIFMISCHSWQAAMTHAATASSELPWQKKTLNLC